MAHAKFLLSAALTGAVAMVWLAGCETASLDNQGSVSLAQLQGYTPPATPTDPTTPSNPSNPTTPTDPTTPGTNSATGGWPAEITGPIHWLHTNVSDWPVTASMSASVGGGTINFPYSKSRVWHAVDGVNANPWVIVNMNGQWYAATFEYLRFGQVSKPVGVLNGSMGDHIKVSPLSSWRPRSGERFGIMVSGLARSNLRNVRERSNVSMVTWP